MNTINLMMFGIGTHKRGEAEQVASVAVSFGDEEAWQADTDAFIDVSIAPLLGLNFGVWKFRRRRVRAALAASNDGFLLHIERGVENHYRLPRPSGQDQAKILLTDHDITGQMADNEAERRSGSTSVPKSLSMAIMVLAVVAGLVTVLAIVPGLGDTFNGFNFTGK